MAAEDRKSPVLHVVVVGFHHQRGSEVEYSYPPIVKGEECWSRNLPIVWKYLPFMALPDGAHNYDSDSTYFHLPYQDTEGGHHRPKTLYGISCYRQMESKDLRIKSGEITRTTVQKCVCIISQVPLFGYIQAKLEVATKVYFEEKDFSQIGILKDVYNNLNSSLSNDVMTDALVHVGLSVMGLIIKFRHRILVLFKLLLLENKVLFYGFPVLNLCTHVLSLVSLIPGMIETGLVQAAGTEDSISDDEDQDPLYPSHLNAGQLSTDQYGLPLAIFNKNSIFHPYLSLQQMDLLKDPRVDGFVVGVSNALYCQHMQLGYDVTVEVETGDLTIHNQDVARALSLSTADLRFTDYLLQHVTEHSKDGGQTVWDGSEEWIRAQFKLYILSLLSTIKHTDGDGMDNYNEEFVAAWKTTRNYAVWSDKEHAGIDEVHAGHPFQGQIGLGDLKIRLSNVYQDVTSKSMQTEQGKKIGQAVAQTGKAVGGAINSARSLVASWLTEFSKDESKEQHSADINSKSNDEREGGSAVNGDNYGSES